MKEKEEFIQLADEQLIQLRAMSQDSGESLERIVNSAINEFFKLHGSYQTRRNEGYYKG